MRRIWIALTLCAVSSLPAQTTSARPILGRVLERSDTTPVAGAVVLLLDARDSTLARTLTDASGRFRLPPGATGASLRVMRIGFRPAARPWSPIANGEQESLELRLERLASVLPALRVVEQPGCPADPDGATTFAVLEQARAALAAAQLAQESNPALVRIIAYDRVFGPDGRELRSQDFSDTTFRSTRGVVSQRSAADYAALGYRDVDTVRSVEHYYAPDAQVLLDPDFAAAHCFRSIGTSSEYPEDIGVVFTPRRTVAGRVDVTGTIWVRRVSPALHVIDFRFTNAESVRGISDSLAGGATVYREMPNGLTIPVRWNVHAPIRVEQRIRVGGRTVNAATTTIAGIRETGGTIATARWDDGTLWDAALPRLTGRVIGDNGRGVQHAVLAIRGTTATVRTDSAGHFTLPPLIDGRYALDVIDETLAEFGVVRNASRVLAVGGAPPSPIEVVLPSLRPFADSLCAGETSTAAGSLGSTAILFGAIRAQDGSPAAGANLRVVWSSAGAGPQEAELLQGETNANGRFHVCGVPTALPIRLSATNGESVAFDTTVMVNPSDLIAPVVMSMTTLSDPRLPPSRRRVLAVEDQAAKLPIPDVDVSEAISERVLGRTSAEGRLPIGALPEGTALLRLRKPGFGQRLVMVPMRVADSSTVHVALSRVTRLDAMQVTSTVTSARATSSGFEDRAAHGPGRFLKSTDLRRFDGQSLESAVRSLGVRDRSQMTGTVLLGGRGGKPCPITIFIDGALFYSHNWRGVDPPDARSLQVSEYAAVEYYADDDLAPAGYSATGAGCGTLLLWTRD